MEQEQSNGELLKINKAIIIVGAVLVGLAIIVGVIVAVNANPPVKTSDNDSALMTQLESEKAEIADAFNDRFQFLYDKYHINKIMLMSEGGYAVVLLELNSASYRSILEKSSDGWVVMGVPAVVLYYEDFPDVPKEVVYAANNLRGDGNE